MLARIITVVVTSLIVTALGTAAHIALFGLTRTAVLPVLLRLPVVSRFLRPFMAHFLRGSFSLALLTKNLGLVFRAFMLGFMTVATWDFAESLFDTYVAEVCHHSSSVFLSTAHVPPHIANKCRAYNRRSDSNDHLRPLVYRSILQALCIR